MSRCLLQTLLISYFYHEVIKILGISAFEREAAAAAVMDGQVQAAARESSFSRQSCDPSFPAGAIRFCLQETGWSPAELDAIVFYQKPLPRFDRLLRSILIDAPGGFQHFQQELPQWISERFFLKRSLQQKLRGIWPEGRVVPLAFAHHHLSQAANAFFSSPFEEAAVVVIDGPGEWTTTTIAIGQGNRITPLKEIRFPHGLALLYSAFAHYLSAAGAEHLLAHLAAYGNPESADFHYFYETIQDKLAALRQDGSLRLQLENFNIRNGAVVPDARRWEQLFGIPGRKPGGEWTQTHCDLALAIERQTEESLLHLAREARQLTGLPKLCLSGKLAQHGRLNGRLYEAGLFDEIYLPPTPGEAGGAIGAALSYYHIGRLQPRTVRSAGEVLHHGLLGPSFSNFEIERLLRQQNLRPQYFADFEDLCQETAVRLAKGQLIGWFQGKQEFSEHPLGNRSLLADPRSPEVLQRFHRQWNQDSDRALPTLAVLEEDAARYFTTPLHSPFGLLQAPLLPEYCTPAPDDYATWPLTRKRAFPKGAFPLCTEADGYALVYSVHWERTPHFWRLLRAFREQSDCSMLMNAPFCGPGQPLASRPQDALSSFQQLDLDALVLNNFLISKE